MRTHSWRTNLLFTTFMVTTLSQCNSVCPAGTAPACVSTAAEHELVTRYTKEVRRGPLACVAPQLRQRIRVPLGCRPPC